MITYAAVVLIVARSPTLTAVSGATPRPDQPQPTLTRISGITVLDDDLRMKCTPGSGRDPAQMLWFSLYRNGQLVDKKRPPDDLLSDGMRFSKEAASLRDAGNYSCTYTDTDGESPHSPAVSIQVYSWTPEKCEISVNVMLEGEVGRVGLNFRRSPHHCTLYLNGQRYKVQTSCQFTLHDSRPGLYSCTLSSKEKTGPMSDAEMVTFHAQPIIQPAPNVSLILNQAYALHCSFDGMGNVSWYPELTGPGIDPLLTGSDVLVFPSMQASDLGIYVCQIIYGEFEFLWSEPFRMFLPPLDRPTLSLMPRLVPDPRWPRPDTIGIRCNSQQATHFNLYKDGVKIASKSHDDRVIIFTIFLTTHSGGLYTCTARNRFGESEHSTSYYLPAPGQLDVTWTPQNVTPGESFTLTCQLGSEKPDLNYRWTIFKSNTSVESRSGQNVTFDILTAQDQGQYACAVISEVHETVHWALSPHFVLAFTVPEIPELREMVFQPFHGPHDKGSGQLLASFGLDPSRTDYYILTCTCSGILCDPHFGFRMYRNGTEVTDVIHRDRADSLTMTLSRLYVININNPSNDGIYTCTTVNRRGESSPILPRPVITAESLDMTTLGQDITFTCHVPDFIPNSEIAWRLDFDTLFRRGRQLTLHVLTAADNGHYTCGFARPTADDFYLYPDFLESDYIELNLDKPWLPTITLADFHNYKEDPWQDSDSKYIFPTGGTIYLSCDSEWDGQARLYKDRVLEETLASWVAPYRFNLTNLETTEHNFTCTISNRFGESDHSYPLTVHVQDRPTVSLSSSPDGNTNQVLTCHTQHLSDGYDIEWKKNGLRISHQTSVQLTVSGQEQGAYQCKQKIGGQYTPLSLEYPLFADQTNKPEIFAYPQPATNYDRLFVEEGSAIVLYCWTTITTSTHATFYRDGQKLIDVEPWDLRRYWYKDNLGQMILPHWTLRYFSSGDTGVYTCRVENHLGLSEHSGPLSIMFKGMDPCASCSATEDCHATMGNFRCSCKQAYMRNQAGNCVESENSSGNQAGQSIVGRYYKGEL